MQKEEQNPVTSHRVHVAEVYFKGLQWDAEGDILRRRIDWMVDQTQGQRVLDVGCNEGILEILLARRGFDVTGVDIDATALEFARHLLANEPEEVGARVRLIHGDLARTVLAVDPFDTVVIGEVLEHLEDPAALLDRSFEFVRPEGRVVITTPLGFRLGEDHRQTFCLSGFLALLKPRCGLELLQVEDGYIRVVGRVSTAGRESWEQFDVDRAMRMAETAFVASQRRLYRKIDGLDRRKKQLKRQVQAGTEKTAQFERRALAETKKTAQLEQQVQAGTEKAAQLEQQVQAGTEKAAQLEQQVQAGTEKAAQLEQQVQAGTEKAAQLEQQVQAGTEKAAQLEQQVQAGTEKAAQLEQQVQAGTEKAAQLEQQVQAGTEKAAQLEQQVQAGTEKAAQLERKLSRLRQHFQMLQSSTSFRAGNALVVAAKEPRTLWRLPALLWRIYRSARPRSPKRPAGTSRRDATGLVTFPALEVPPPQRSDVPVVAAILDTFSEYCLRYEADLVLLTPKDWREEIARSRPAFLLVESAWCGNNGAWRYVITHNLARESNPLRDLLRYCREHDISTVFWNKEDPPNFEFFIDAAKEFDIVFTSDADCIPRYREMCGHDRIYPMPFAAQPRLHNPCRKTSWPNHAVCFAGSWMGEKHQERTESMRFLLEPALRFGLHIFDRNLDRTDLGQKASMYRFPDRYQTAIKGSLNYEEMLTAYRCYDVMLNANSVTDSPTMFSRRVFECLACGTPVVSTESTGMREMLGDHVRVTRSAEETAAHLNALLSDDEARAREGHLAYRHAHEHHTYRHRMDEMLSRVGLKPQEPARPTVSVVISTCRPRNVTHALENFARQSYQEKELLLVLNNSSFDIDSIRAQARACPNVHVLQMEGQPTLGACLNRAVREASGAYIAKMDDDDHYGERYISDMMLAAAYSDAEILGKGAYFAYLEGPNKMALREVRADHQYTDMVAGASLTVRREVLERVTFQNRNSGEDTAFLMEAVQAGCRVYSADRFNYVSVRRANPAKHTWKIKDAEFLKSCRNLQPGLDLGRTMI